jgi:hypothetical protein
MKARNLNEYLIWPRSAPGELLGVGLAALRLRATAPRHERRQRHAQLAPRETTHAWSGLWTHTHDDDRYRVRPKVSRAHGWVCMLCDGCVL